MVVHGLKRVLAGLGGEVLATVTVEQTANSKSRKQSAVDQDQADVAMDDVFEDGVDVGVASGIGEGDGGAALGTTEEAEAKLEQEKQEEGWVDAETYQREQSVDEGDLIVEEDMEGGRPVDEAEILQGKEKQAEREAKRKARKEHKSQKRKAKEADEELSPRSTKQSQEIVMVPSEEAFVAPISRSKTTRKMPVDGEGKDKISKRKQESSNGIKGTAAIMSKKSKKTHHDEVIVIDDADNQAPTTKMDNRAAKKAAKAESHKSRSNKS